MKKISSKELIQRIMSISVLGFFVIFIVFWHLQVHRGIDYGNSLYGPVYDPVNFGAVEGVNHSKRYGMTDDECNKLDGTVQNCKQHWFGDFYRNYEVVQTFSPWITEGENPNFPLPNLLTKTLANFDYSVAISMYLILSALVMVVPLIHALSVTSSDLNKIMVVTILGLGSYPFLFTLDRANAQAFAPVLIYFFGYFLIKKRPAVSVNFIIILMAFKLHTWPIAILLKNKIAKKEMLKIIIGVFLLIVIPIMFWDADVFNSLKGWWSTIAGMVKGGGDSLIFVWRNQSLIGFFSNICLVFDQIVALHILKYSAVVPAVLYGLFIMPVVFSRKLPISIKLFSLASLMIIAVPRGYGYGLNFIIAILALMIVENYEIKFSENDRLAEIYLNYIFPIAFSMLIMPDFSLDVDFRSLSNGAVLFKNFSTFISCVSVVVVGYLLEYGDYEVCSK